MSLVVVVEVMSDRVDPVWCLCGDEGYFMLDEVKPVWCQVGGDW